MITPPPHIGRFTVQRVIGHGGMGVVYLARDPQLGRDVAIKVLPPLAGDAFADRLLNEARLSGRFVHPNVIAIYEVGEEGGYPFFVMPYVQGRTLDAIVKAREFVPLSLKLRWMVELCRGLDYAHGFQVIHRDVKPANLIVDGQDVLRILDFGIAKLVATTQAQFTAVGTPAYMAPEQYTGAAVDARTDVYAAGLVLFELLTYARARSGETPAQIYRQIAAGDLPPLRSLAPDVDAAIAAICERATAADPAARFQSAREMGDALARTQTRAAYREQAEPAIAGDPEAATVPGTIRAPAFASPPGPRLPPPSSTPPPFVLPPPPTPPPMPVAAPRPALEPPPFEIRRDSWEPPSPGPASWNAETPKASSALPAIVVGAVVVLGAIALVVLFALLPSLRKTPAVEPAPIEADTATRQPALDAPSPAPVEAERPAAAAARPAPAPVEIGAPAAREPAPLVARKEAAPPPPPPPAPVRVGGTIRAPEKLRNVSPVYPAIAQSAGVQGVVILEATIAPSGKVQDVKVVRSIPLLDQPAVDAVRQWEYAPTLLNGVPVPVIMTVTVTFTLTPAAPVNATAPVTTPGAATGAPAAAAPAADAGTFSGDAGLLLVQVAPGSESAYERLLRRARDALHAGSSRRTAMGSGWRVYRGGTMGGNALYVHVVDQPDKAADYVQLYRLVHEAFPGEVAALHAALKDAFPKGMNKVNLRLVRAPIQRGGTPLAGVRAADEKPTFTASSGLLLASVKPAETGTYETAFYTLSRALSSSPKPERRGMMENWLLFKADTTVNGDALYVSRVDPVIPGANYLDTYTLVSEARGTQEGYAAADAIRRASGPMLNRLDLTLVVNMGARN